jgi:hypothetical protein
MAVSEHWRKLASFCSQGFAGSIASNKRQHLSIDIHNFRANFCCTEFSKMPSHYFSSSRYQQKDLGWEEPGEPTFGIREDCS